MHRSFYLFVVIVLSYLPGYPQTKSAVDNDVSSKIKTYFADHINEKVYLHFDKPYYAAGDTIYFKAYLAMGEKHEPSSISGVLYVDLINGGNEIKQSIKLQVVSGVAWGDFALPDELPPGNYQVRAYTNWMRNEATGNFFTRSFFIGTYKTDIPPVVLKTKELLSNSKNDLQFFPEGGNLVIDLNSKIAFKAIGINGIGIDAKGTISDNENKMVGSFTSSHLGMGYFYLKPEKGKNYKANIFYADGTSGIIDLPKAETYGITLSLNNDSVTRTSVKIEANDAYYALNKNNDYYLLIYSGGTATTIKCKLDSQTISLDILKRHLFTGVTSAILLSAAGEPLCERLFFVQNYNQLNLSVATDQKQFTVREQMSLKLKAQNRADEPVAGQFSAAVVDENKVPFDEDNEPTILTNLLLTSDLKGYIEKPNYYFRNVGDHVTKDLDLVMLTHGYRRFKWKGIINKEYKPNSFEAERGLEINGFVKTLGGKQPVKAGLVTLIPVKAGAPFSAKTDMDGCFSFKNLFFTDTLSFILNAVNAKGKDLTKIIYQEKKGPEVLSLEQPDVEDNKTIQTYMANNARQQAQINKYGLSTGKMLQEVQIRSKRHLVLVTNHGIADKVVSGDQIRLYGGGTLLQKLNIYRFHPGGALVVLNGTDMPLDFDINSINIDDVKEVAEIAGPTGGGLGYHSTLIINTTFGLQPKDMVVTGLLPIKVVGFYTAREFYSPRYDVAQSPIEDLRTTIFWNPNVVTDKDGSASFNFYNSDGTGTYRVTIEGMDDKGNIGRTVYRYHVK